MAVEASVPVAYSDCVIDAEPDIHGESVSVPFADGDTDEDTEDEGIGDNEYSKLNDITDESDG